jgi:hypothetical protein
MPKLCFYNFNVGDIMHFRFKPAVNIESKINAKIDKLYDVQSNGGDNLVKIKKRITSITKLIDKAGSKAGAQKQFCFTGLKSRLDQAAVFALNQDKCNSFSGSYFTYRSADEIIFSSAKSRLDLQFTHGKSQVEFSKAELGGVTGSQAVETEVPQKKLNALFTDSAALLFSKHFKRMDAPTMVEAKLAAPMNKVTENTILVHGTYDSHATEEGWTNPDKFAPKSHEQISSLSWSGKNHRGARIDAAKVLVERIKLNHAQGVKTKIVAHSHGGNVAFEAIKLLKQEQKENSKIVDIKIDQLITLATPVRKDHLPEQDTLNQYVNQHTHAYGGKDSVIKFAHIDNVTPGKGLLHGDKMSWSALAQGAKKTQLSFQQQVKISDASHTEMCDPTVLKLFDIHYL